MSGTATETKDKSIQMSFERRALQQNSVNSDVKLERALFDYLKYEKYL